MRYRDGSEEVMNSLLLRLLAKQIRLLELNPTEDSPWKLSPFDLHPSAEFNALLTDYLALDHPAIDVSYCFRSCSR